MRLSGLALCLVLAGPARGGDEEAAELLRSGRLEDALEAAARFEARVSRAPGDFEGRLGAALALNQVMAIQSNGNLPLIDGLQDSEANKALWQQLGGRALEHARRAHSERPDSVLAAAALATSYMFYASGLGILRSILQGAGGEYRVHAQRLVDLDPRHEDALGHTLLASFFLVAPWPVGDDDAALEHYERALELAPGSVRNHYGLGVYWARNADPRRARPYFERAEAMPCGPTSERLFCDWIKAESRRVLESLAGSSP